MSVSEFPPLLTLCPSLIEDFFLDSQSSHRWGSGGNKLFNVKKKIIMFYLGLRPCLCIFKLKNAVKKKALMNELQEEINGKM